jgi:hypothetical protein
MMRKFVFSNCRAPLLLSVMVVGITALMPYAFASHGNSPAACEAHGYEAGLDGPFSPELYEMCEEGADAYYQGFIEGCMSVEGNTRDTCESATDADE